MEDIIKLETDEQEVACNIVNMIYEKAIKQGGTKQRNILKKCYGDSWDTIKERMETEGSCWYVWYMDGVNNFIINYMRK